MHKIVVFALTAALATGAASDLSAKPPSHGMRQQHMTPHATGSKSTQAYKEAHMKMMQAAPAYVNNADADFRLQMIPHHQGAIDMAKVALKYATDESTKVMARQIIAAQEKEIAEMRDWLEQYNKAE